ncbi:MAG: polysaccharide pyruvyl transferase family protein, partial [Pseudomonadota bacterium]
DEAEVRRTYRDAHYVCLPYAANFEGSSGVFSNAVAFEKPVIATDHGVLGERVRRHGLGLTYPAGDRRALAELLETLPAPGSKTYDAMAAAAARYHRANDRAAWSKALVSVVEAGIRQTRNLAPAQPSALAQKVAAAPAAAPIHRGAAMQPNVQALIEEAAIAPPALDYAPILLLDTAVASRNMGDHIIMDAIKLFLRFIFPKSLFVTAPTHEYAGSETLKLMESAAHTFVCGTNLLSSNADEYKQWKLSGADAFVLKELTLLGVGWWQYQSAPNAYTSFLYRNILSAKTLHAVRDGYTRRQLGAAGVGNAINTSCPTLWGLTRRHVARLPRAKSDTVVFTFTDYAQKPEADGAILRALAGTYGAVHCWLQGAGDYAYAQKLGVEGVKYIAPTVEAYTEFLRDNDCDYVGTRLHAGVRALQMGRRALVLAVDNRAKEISSDCGLPVLPREDFAAIRAALADGWPMEIAVPYGDINAWIGQFSPGRAVDFESLLDTALHGFDPLEAKPAPQVLPQVRTREPAPAPAPVRTVVDVADHLEREGYAHYTVHIRLPGTATAATLLVFRTAASYGATLRPLPEHQIDPDAFAGLSMESDRYGPFVRLFFMADSAEVLASADLGENGGALLAWLAARLGDCANGTARYLHHARIADRGGAEAFITAAARALLACVPSAAGGTHTAAQRAKDRVSL